MSDTATDTKKMLDILVRQFAAMHLLVEQFQAREPMGAMALDRCLVRQLERCDEIVQDWIHEGDEEAPMTVEEVGVRVSRALCEDLLRRVDEALSPEGDSDMDGSNGAAIAVDKEIAKRIITNAHETIGSRDDRMATFGTLAANTGATLDDIEATFTGREGWVLNNTAEDRANWYVEVDAG